MIKRSLLLSVGLFAVLSLFLAACGDEDDDPTATSAVAITPTVAAEETPAGDDDGDDGDDGEIIVGDAELGEEIVSAQCSACHSIDGSELVGPTFEGIWGREETLDDGSTVVVDEAYVVESIREPNAKVVEGYQPVMPAFDLSDDDIANVIAYMQSIS
jgi:cytochrome c2